MSVARNAQLTPFTSSWRGPRTPCTPHQLRIAAEAGAIAASLLQHQNPYAVDRLAACPERCAVWQAAYDTASAQPRRGLPFTPSKDWPTAIPQPAPEQEVVS